MNYTKNNLHLTNKDGHKNQHPFSRTNCLPILYVLSVRFYTSVNINTSIIILFSEGQSCWKIACLLQVLLWH